MRPEQHTTLKLDEITLLFIATENDYNVKIKIIGFNQLKRVERIDVDFDAIKRRIDSLTEEEPFVLFLHLNAMDIIDNNNQWPNALRGLVDDIKGKLNLQVYYNTSEKTHKIIEFVKDRIPQLKDNHLFGNNDITESIKDLTIQISTKKNMTTSISVSKPTESQEEASIFLSHASGDNDIMKDFKEMLLEAGLQIPAKCIFYSSERASGVSTSDNIPTALCQEIKNRTLFIRYVSKHYNKSVVCHNEYGAAWYKNQQELVKIITLKEKDLPDNKVGFLNDTRLFVKIEDQEALREFRQENKNYFPDTNDNKWEENLSKFSDKHFPKTQK